MSSPTLGERETGFSGDASRDAVDLDMLREDVRGPIILACLADMHAYGTAAGLREDVAAIVSDALVLYVDSTQAPNKGRCFEHLRNMRAKVMEAMFLTPRLDYDSFILLVEAAESIVCYVGERLPLSDNEGGG